MADNVTFQTTAATPASGTVVATDDISGVHYQVVKVALGLNNAIDTHLDSGQQLMAASLPVVLASDQNDIKITLDGESVAISGTVQVQSNSANLATQATVAAIQTAVELIDNAISGAEMQTDIVSITAGASADLGATTDAEATGNGSIIAILKRLRTLLGGTLTVSGTVAVSAISSALPAGTNNIGDVDVASIAAGDNNIGNVDIASIAAGDNNIGNVDIVTMPNVTIGTMANLAESLVDDAAFTPGTSRVLPVGFEFDDSTPDSVNEGDIGAARMSANRNIYVTLRDAAGNERGANVNASSQLETSAAQSGTWNITNISGTVSLPTGAATAANQSTAITHLSTVAGAVSGTEMQVDVVGSLPAGSNAIGKLAANSGVDIGDVDVTSVIPGTGATNLGKAVDSAAGGTDTGIAALAVRDDSLSALTPVEGDYVPLRVSSTGALHVTGGGGGTEYVVNDVAPADPTGATFVMERDDALATLSEAEGDWTQPRANSKGALWVAIDGGGSGGTSMTDDAAFTPGSGGITPIGAMFDDTTPDSVDEGDGGVVRMSANRNLYVTVRDAAGNERGLNIDASGNIGVTDAGAALTVDNGGTFAVQVSSIAAGDNNIGNVDIASALPAGTNNIGDVDILSVVPGTGATNLGKAEDAAHTSGDVGVMALSVRQDTAAALGQTDADYQPLITDASGRLHVLDANTAAIKTAVETLDNAISGSEMQVDVVGALPAGNNNIGDVDIASIAAGDNNIGNVDIVTMPNVTLAAGTNTNEVVGDVAQDAAVGGNPLLIGGRASAAAPSDMSADGDAVYLWTTLKGALNVADGGGSLTVDVGTALPAGTNNIGDVDILSIAAGDNNIGNVDIVTMPNVAQSTASNLNAQVVGEIADDGADSGNPQKVGGVMKPFDGTDPGSLSAENDRGNLIVDDNRRLYVNIAHPNRWNANENHTTAQTNNALKAAPGAGLRLYITDATFSTDTAMNIKLVEDTGGTPATLAGPYYFAANGGMNKTFITPLIVSVNKDIGFTSSAAGNHTVTLSGYIAP